MIELSFYTGMKKIMGFDKLSVRMNQELFSTIEELIVNYLFINYPRIEEIFVDKNGNFNNEISLILNNVIANKDSFIKEGDHIVFLTPITGG
ncbi:MoaD/ThiS family protein [Enterococcus sp. BWB1-3]|uniref:MoaD/ThiS family protein n=1 Tax=Enterococcus sp. BWB1-3 TaxID=2787713 RepID=UPI0019215986|nr:MoaD/ThiS family protein [Enterococcus sp. BWB1-3]MBL1230067.1 MoaD/ThiS family protein [Enterococcus sp. BWB1-3]